MRLIPPRCRPVSWNESKRQQLNPTKKRRALTCIQRTHSTRLSRTIRCRLTGNAGTTKINASKLSGIVIRDTSTPSPGRRLSTTLETPTGSDFLALARTGDVASAADALFVRIADVSAASAVLRIGIDVYAFAIATLEAVSGAMEIWGCIV